MPAARKNATINMYGTGQRIKQIMEWRGLTAKDVQEHLGLTTTQSIYHWFRGRNLPTIDNLYSLSELFRVPIDAMVCGDREGDFDYMIPTSLFRFMLYYEKLQECTIR